jgi:hypothetical protein
MLSNLGRPIYERHQRDGNNRTSGGQNDSIIAKIRNKSYPDRVQELTRITLERRRLRGQLIEVLNYLKGFTRTTTNWLFDRDHDNRTRNNGEKLHVKIFKTTIAENLYPVHITQTWNRLCALPNHALPSHSILLLYVTT